MLHNHKVLHSIPSIKKTGTSHSSMLHTALLSLYSIFVLLLFILCWHLNQGYYCLVLLLCKKQGLTILPKLASNSRASCAVLQCRCKYKQAHLLLDLLSGFSKTVLFPFPRKDLHPQSGISGSLWSCPCAWPLCAVEHAVVKRGNSTSLRATAASLNLYFTFIVKASYRHACFILSS